MMKAVGSFVYRLAALKGGEKKHSQKQRSTKNMAGEADSGGGGGKALNVGRLSKGILSREMDETLHRIQENKNVVGLVVINAEGLPLKSTLDSTLTVQVQESYCS